MISLHVQARLMLASTDQSSELGMAGKLLRGVSLQNPSTNLGADTLGEVKDTCYRNCYNLDCQRFGVYRRTGANLVEKTGRQDSLHRIRAIPGEWLY